MVEDEEPTEGNGDLRIADVVVQSTPELVAAEIGCEHERHHPCEIRERRNRQDRRQLQRVAQIGAMAREAHVEHADRRQGDELVQPGACIGDEELIRPRIDDDAIAGDRQSQ
jgi:hypothetical protein